MIISIGAKEASDKNATVIPIKTLTKVRIKRNSST